jgi:hypothetical protein
MFANVQANDPENNPITLPQAAATQKWKSVLDTHYPLMKETGNPYFRSESLEKDTKEII